ncbi:glycoside hydrolase family 3 C-terminal domain-containing protein [Bifidobacterium platyrrhinorum]|uniref:Beta-glucosidase n=1 Tax=Bifidobacterium platyrrhinorum TaxID=2661628 RepID=A0A6L9SVR8_9BIFI|nr:glycoside hydrolase family 3 C-terminal domain-containing protein [Bifidobacterium platyrrhinorum]NEG55642.1 beta-glucosidase [Bifidobacterium platyrrhinorum]
MLQINFEDVIGVLETCKPYLIALAVVVALMIVGMVIAHWFKGHRAFVRGNVAVVGVASILVIANLIALGPMSTLISLTMGSGQATAQTTQKAKAVAEKIAGEGTVLLKNDDNLLPLTDTSKVNMFGWTSANPVYGGTGSGAINDLYETVSIEQGLKNAGISVNQDLIDFYKDYQDGRDNSSDTDMSWQLPEPPVSTYSDRLINDAKQYSDVAVLVLGRLGGEGYTDLPTDASGEVGSNSKDYRDFESGEHYLQLSKTERDLVDLVCKNFDDVIVLYNGNNPMQLGFINEHPQIKSALWLAGAGNVGFNALGKIIAGDIDPSGRTSDTFVYDMTSTPWWNNVEKTSYSNLKNLTVTGLANGKMTKFSPSFINYAEGIYVGYKYYETAADEGIIDYDKTVQYPFGYGLSYTTFEQKMSDIKESGDNLTFTVTVTNTGDKAGKDVVEVYSNPPYTNGGVEKATANLVAAEKTPEIRPGASQKVSISIGKDDLASYDYQDAKAYVLDAGDYEISINSDSHTVLDHRTYTVGKKIVYSGDTTHDGDKQAATNQFADMAGDVTYLSRKDHFANYDSATAKGSDVMPDKYKAKYHLNKTFDHTMYLKADAKMPTTGAKNGLKLADLRGADYDDPRWEKLLDEMTVDEMTKLTSLAGFQTAAVKSIDKVATNDADGPAAINNNFTGAGSIGFPVETVTACTWNADLAESFGDIIGQLAREMNVSGWYAPGANMHRTPFGARNFEYYSEDATLSGIMAAHAVKGAAERGVYAYIKHFALYDSNARMVSVWSNEQAVREIYLKPFEMAVKDGDAHAVMNAWSFLGTTWAGESGNLNSTVLRDEWGFQGMVLTDYFREDGRGFMTADAALANGTDAMLATYGSGPNIPADTNDASTVQYMRNASKNVLYTVVNSWVYEDSAQNVGMETWKKITIGADAVLAVVLIGIEVLMIRRYLARRKTATITVVKTR